MGSYIDYKPYVINICLTSGTRFKITRDTSEDATAALKNIRQNILVHDGVGILNLDDDKLFVSDVDGDSPVLGAEIPIDKIEAIFLRYG